MGKTSVFRAAHRGLLALLALSGLAPVAGCGEKTIVKVDVVGERAFADVTLTLTITGEGPKTFAHVTFGPSTTYRAGVLVSADRHGAVSIVGKAESGGCIVGMGSLALDDVRAA